jgi:hypothetical protein
MTDAELLYLERYCCLVLVLGFVLKMSGLMAQLLG